MEPSATTSEHPTKRAIMLATRSLLEQRGVRGFRLDDVLEQAFVSKGAVYHHFADFDALLEEVQLDWYEEMEQADIDSLRAFVEVSDLDGFRQVIAATTRAAYDPGRQAQRANRITILGSVAFGSAELRAGYAAVQSRLNHALAEVIALAQQRRLVRAAIDAEALAAIIYALTFGRAFNEVAGIATDPDVSSSVLLELLGSILETEP